MTEQLRVEHENGAGHGRYVIHLEGGHEAEMTYRTQGPGVVIIDHTYTPPEFRGRNIASMLMDAAIADARERGHRIVPQCSYAAAQFRRHPEWSDLLAQ